eukprot:TRINITY_DN57260_c0_g1_i1.p1 TRINITY_DN57260_c0_g1~~TRINITY_DN57260_c0_g1_i1.p1  ORF type:complete len:581 (+),score=69.65 TRINITY_DN57260_c0_g1_i1:206-1744(+)
MEVAEHPSWRKRVLWSFGGDFEELRLEKPTEWRGLCGRLAGVSAGLARLCHPSTEVRSRALAVDYNVAFDEAASLAVEVRWTLILPSPAGLPIGVVWFDGAACRFFRFGDHAPQILWTNPGAPYAASAVVALNRLFLLCAAEHALVFSFAGEQVGILQLPKEWQGSQESFDLLAEATDWFASGDGRHVILESSRKVLVWDSTTFAFLCEIVPAGWQDTEVPIQCRTFGPGTIVLWQEGGQSAQVWALKAQPHLVAEWHLDNPHPGLTIEQVGVSFGHGLLSILDTENDLHVVEWSQCASFVDVERSLDSAPFEQCMRTCKTMRFPLFEGSRQEEGRVLPCSMALRGGMLSFVEASDFSSRHRRLHVWDLLDDAGAALETPLQWSWPFETHASATASVTQPALRRFVLLKMCSFHEEGLASVSFQLFDTRSSPNGPVYESGQEVVREALVHNSSLFRRIHPLCDGCVVLWSVDEPETYAAPSACASCGSQGEKSSNVLRVLNLLGEGTTGCAA